MVIARPLTAAVAEAITRKTVNTKFLKRVQPMSLFSKHRIEEIDVHLSREDLLRRSRILVIDDERPDIIDDLTKAHFSVDYLADITKDNLDTVDRPLYDLIILDFGNVGTDLGSDQGLSILRHIKRVNPTAIILAYTSKALGTDYADFFRMADGVLSKDAGITDSMEKIEENLRKAHSVENLWTSVLRIASIAPGSVRDLEWQDLYIRGLKKENKMKVLKQKVLETAGGEGAQKVAIIIIERLVELGAKAVIGV